MYALEGTLTTQQARHTVQATEKGKRKVMVERVATGTITQEFFQRSLTFTAQRPSSLPHYMSLFSFGTGLSDQEWHNIIVTTSPLSTLSP
jgi:hypothetical protein